MLSMADKYILALAVLLIHLAFFVGEWKDAPEGEGQANFLYSLAIWLVDTTGVLGFVVTMLVLTKVNHFAELLPPRGGGPRRGCSQAPWSLSRGLSWTSSSGRGLGGYRVLKPTSGVELRMVPLPRRCIIHIDGIIHIALTSAPSSMRSPTRGFTYARSSFISTRAFMGFHSTRWRT